VRLPIALTIDIKSFKSKSVIVKRDSATILNTSKGINDTTSEISVIIIVTKARFTLKRFVKGEIIETTPK
jgi:hypothetical protein